MISELSFLKFILGLPPNATNAAVRGELGQLPLHLYWKERILKYWKRICEGNIPTILLHAVSVSEVMSQSDYQASSAFSENGFEQIEINIVMLRSETSLYNNGWNSSTVHLASVGQPGIS